MFLDVLRERQRESKRDKERERDSLGGSRWMFEYILSELRETETVCLGLWLDELLP